MMCTPRPRPQYLVALMYICSFLVGSFSSAFMSSSSIHKSIVHPRVLSAMDTNIDIESVEGEPEDKQHNVQSRRGFAKSSVMPAILSLVTPLTESPKVAMAANEDGEDLVEVYFGCGCFWHVQHEFVEAEKNILGRTDSQITARAGYAGGTAGALDGKVCYHNAASIADYGKLGHAEVVGLKIPPSKLKDFAAEYFKLFDKKGDRPDQAGDRGSEYRSLVGIPGGAKSDYAKLLVDTSIANGDKLDFAYGKGNDKDTRKTSFVMDTADFPFFVAEQYHQFHDGFNFNENYPSNYNNLASAYAKAGETFGNCPNGSLGLGIGGL